MKNKFVILIILLAFFLNVFAEEAEVETVRDERDSEIYRLNSQIDSLMLINTLLLNAREFSALPNDSLVQINASLLTQLERERAERVIQTWRASNAVFERRERELDEFNDNILKNKWFYIGVWSGAGTGFPKARGLNYGFSASVQLGRTFALRTGVDWMNSAFVNRKEGYVPPGSDRFDIPPTEVLVLDTAKALQIPFCFEWAIRRRMVSTQIYGGMYFLGNQIGFESGAIAPGLTAGVDFGIKAWRGYGFIGFKAGTSIVEYETWRTLMFGYQFALLGKERNGNRRR